MAVLIERHSYFTVATRAGELPARRPLKPKEKRRLKELETALGKRKSASRACVRSCFESLEQILKPDLPLVLQSDQKRTYPSECRRAIGNRTFIHRTTSSRNLRDYRNLIFPINHTLAMMRDGMSCLVRRSWAAAKTIRGLERHAAIWVAYRNYVRGITNKTGTTPAQEAGICREPYRMKDIARWRWPDRNPI
jgi:hypothetical protein